MKTSLRIQEFQIFVHLGCTAQERKTPQEVRVSIQMIMKKPVACKTDELSDTICYGSICQSLSARVKSLEINTIEHLGQILWDTLVSQVPKGTKLKLKIHKTNPPIENLLDGVCFEMESNR